MEGKKPLLPQLILLSKVDSTLAGIFAEKKKIEKELSDLTASIKQVEKDRRQKSALYDDKKFRYTKEEHRLRDESDKLVGRRKALTSLSNYKLQQSAEKEIEQAARAITAQEETLLETLEEVDKLAADLKSADDSLASLKDSYAKANEESKQSLAALQEREQKFQQERLSLAQDVDAKSLTQYDRIKERFVMDPVVEVVNNQCSGCHMQVGPQVIVQINRADSLVRCPGCGRILFLKGSEPASA